jgi:hypothetical protein
MKRIKQYLLKNSLISINHPQLYNSSSKRGMKLPMQHAKQDIMFASALTYNKLYAVNAKLYSNTQNIMGWKAYIST